METIALDESTLEDLRAAFQYNRYDTECFLDAREGRVIWFSDDAPAMDREPDEEDADWVHEAYEKRVEIWEDDRGRYLEVPPSDVRDACEDMAAFLEEGEAGPRLRETFDADRANPRTFQGFRRALERDRESLEAWRRFRKERVTGRIVEWLELHGYRLELREE